VYRDFVAQFLEHTRQLKVGNGLDAASSMGPLANPRRVQAMQSLTDDACAQHAQLLLGGKPMKGAGNFWEPTVLTEVPNQAHAMSDEPFGPMALINPFATFDDAVREANRLPAGRKRSNAAKRSYHEAYSAASRTGSPNASAMALASERRRSDSPARSAMK
jgi:succinate-semialdehyde dehydrogenase/glutarate-semialdehyde dehydrogenase